MFIKKISKVWKFLTGSFVFHHGPESAAGAADHHEEPPRAPVLPIPDKAESIDHAKTEVILDQHTASIDAKESKEMNEKDTSHVEPFQNNPDKMASPEHLNDFFKKQTDDIGQIWRLLCLPRQMQYGLIQDKPPGSLHGSQVKFLRGYEREIRQNNQFSKESYSKRPAIQRVPVLAVPLKHRNVLKPTDKPIFMLGALAGDMAKDKDLQGRAEYVPNSDDPVSALNALKAQPAEKLSGATLTINFGSEMFLGDAKPETLIAATEELLKFAKENKMKVVMGTPLYLSIYIASRTGRVGSLDKEGAIKADELRKRYTDFLAEQYQQGSIQALVGIGLGMTRAHLVSFTGKPGGRVDELNYYKDSNDLGKGLTEEGTLHCASAMIDGINFANGDSSGTTTSADYERTIGGAGTAYDVETHHVVEVKDNPVRAREILKKEGGGVDTVELIPDYQKRFSIATLPDAVRTHLWALCAINNYTGIGAAVGSGDLEYHCKEAEEAINNSDELPPGPQRDYATEQFYALKSSLYYGRAWWAAVKGNNKGAIGLIDEAVSNNRKYLEMGDATYSDANLSTDALNRIRPNARLFAMRLKTLQEDMKNNISYLGFGRNVPDPEKYVVEDRPNNAFDPEKVFPRPKISSETKSEKPST